MKDREYKPSQVGFEVLPSWRTPDAILKSLASILGHRPSIDDRGLYNGYVIVCQGHPYFGLPYDDERLHEIHVHGGLTFSQEHNGNPDFWVFGFDTAHFGDTPERWTFDAVLQETLRLRQQFADVGMAYEKLMS
jgi:hypothetical protein